MTGSELEFTTSWGRDGRLSVKIANGQARHVDRLNPQSAQARKRFRGALTEAIPALDEAALQDIEERLVALASEGPPKRTDGAGPSDAELLARHDQKVETLLGETSTDVLQAASELLNDPKLIDRIVRDVHSLGVAGEATLVPLLYLLGTSRLLAQPLAACIQGTSSSGKSYLIDKVASLMPEESVLRATDMTANALYYLEAGSLMHGFVAAGGRKKNESDDTADRTRALREMISAGELRKLVPERLGDRFITIVIRAPGPIAYVESTTVTQFNNEDANRMLLLGTDDSPEQTRRILSETAARAAGKVGDTNSDLTVRVHHAAQRLLRRVYVRVPFAEQLLAAMPSKLPETRRAAGLVLNAVRASALLHQRQRGDRDLEHGDTIDACWSDYGVVRPLLLRPLSVMLGGGLPVIHRGVFARCVADHPCRAVKRGGAGGCRDRQG